METKIVFKKNWFFYIGEKSEIFGDKHQKCDQNYKNVTICDQNAVTFFFEKIKGTKMHFFLKKIKFACLHKKICDHFEKKSSQVCACVYLNPEGFKSCGGVRTRGFSY